MFLALFFIELQKNPIIAYSKTKICIFWLSPKQKMKPCDNIVAAVTTLPSMLSRNTVLENDIKSW